MWKWMVSFTLREKESLVLTAAVLNYWNRASQCFCYKTELYDTQNTDLYDPYAWTLRTPTKFQNWTHSGQRCSLLPKPATGHYLQPVPPNFHHHNQSPPNHGMLLSHLLNKVGGGEGGGWWKALVNGPTQHSLVILSNTWHSTYLEY